MTKPQNEVATTYYYRELHGPKLDKYGEEEHCTDSEGTYIRYYR